LARHVGRKCLRKTHGLHDAILDSHNKSLLLIRACTNTDSGQELPDVDIFAGVDRTGEYGRKTRLKGVEEFVIDNDPAIISTVLSMLKHKLTIAPTPVL
jgi:hypothetical protein